MTDTLWIGTRKGLFALRRHPRGWKLTGPQFLGHIVHHVVQDPREPKRLVMAAKTGHLGPTIYHSADRGRTWKESKQPPAFPKVAEGEKGRAVQTTFWLTAGHASQDGTWYCGTAPPGLFRSGDHGATWTAVTGFNDNPMYPKWAAGFATPGGELLHSVLVDPRDPQHLYLSLSVGGTFESADGGANWSPLNQGVHADFLPEPDAPWGHDPHLVAMHPKRPDRLFQQNHCGIYRLDRPASRWQRIGDNMPRKVKDIGFPIVLHAENPDIAWVFPMDGTTVWPRTSVDGKPAVYMTRDGGRKWQRQDAGFPRSQAWWTVLRQAMCRDDGKGPGLYLGNTNGEVWGSAKGGARWQNLARHLPQIYSLTFAASRGRRHA